MNDPKVHQEIARIKSKSGKLPLHPFPQPPDLVNNAVPIKARLKLVQAYITSLEYNFTGEEFFVKKKDRGFLHVTSTAKLIIREALPIQCVDAVFLGAYLTSEMNEVDRFPVSFRSTLDGRVFRHIVLAVRFGRVWGALGLSRRDTLMYKELRYASFSDLMADFRESYAGSWHRLEHLWVGFPFPHDISSNVPVKWKVMRAAVGTESEWTSAGPDLNRFVTYASGLFDRFRCTGRIPDHPALRNSGAPDDISTGGGDSKTNGCNGDGAGGGGVCSSPMGGSAGDGVERSPGAPCVWVLPGGRRRRASMPIRGKACDGSPTTPAINTTFFRGKRPYLAEKGEALPVAGVSKETDECATIESSDANRIGKVSTSSDVGVGEGRANGMRGGDVTRCGSRGSSISGTSIASIAVCSPPRPRRARSAAGRPKKETSASKSQRQTNISLVAS